jgi:NAD(P)H-dependent FMN reductase
VIIGSTREGRVGGGIGQWIADHAAARTRLAVTLVDLADYDLPAHYPQSPTPQMAAFAARIGEADAFIVVTPEYNRSFPASLKQAIDCAYDEWQAKPIGFVSYGCGSDGRYAVEHLRTVFTELHAVTMRNGVAFDLLACTDGEARAAAADTMLDQLHWWGRALRDARTERPYVA